MVRSEAGATDGTEGAGNAPRAQAAQREHPAARGSHPARLTLALLRVPSRARRGARRSATARERRKTDPLSPATLPFSLSLSLAAGALSERPYALKPNARLSIGRAAGSHFRLELAYAASTHCTLAVFADRVRGCARRGATATARWRRRGCARAPRRTPTASLAPPSRPRARARRRPDRRARLLPPSRRHCLAQVTVRNEAASGTFVNGELVCTGTARLLAFGDRISFVEPRHAHTLGYILFRTSALRPRADHDGAGLEHEPRAPSALEAEPEPRAAGAPAAAACAGPSSAQLLASDGDTDAPVAGDASAQPSPCGCIGWLSGDNVRSILAKLDADDLVNARLVCKAFRDNSDPPAVKRRDAYLRTSALAAYAWEALKAYVLAETHVLLAHLHRQLDADSATTSLDLGCAPSTARGCTQPEQQCGRAHSRASLA